MSSSSSSSLSSSSALGPPATSSNNNANNVVSASSLASLQSSHGTNTNCLTLSVKELNENLGCKLCGGYFRDAQTVPDCLHSFCKVCLYKFLQRTQTKECPLCGISLGPMPWNKVIFDRTLQGLVDKIFPHFVEGDKKFGG
jgi:hypothetical protein